MASSPPGTSNNDKPESDPKFKAITYALQHQGDVSASAKNVASTLREAADLHPDPEVGEEWRRQADKFVDSSPDDRDDTLKEIGMGLLKIIGAPLALAGLGIYAAGEIVTGVGRATGLILTGVGSVLKGIGKLGKEALLGKK